MLEHSNKTEINPVANNISYACMQRLCRVALNVENSINKSECKNKRVGRPPFYFLLTLSKINRF